AMAITLTVMTAGVAAWQASQLRAQSSAVPASLHTRPSGLATRAKRPGTTRPAAGDRAEAGNGVLSVAPLAARGPQVRAVVALLTTYFEALNSQNFAEYDRLFVPSMQRMMSHFGPGYAGTFDSGVTLTRLAATGPRGLAATVAFISHQNPASSVDGAACDSWLITLFLRRQASALLIRHPRPGFPQSVLACH
ncbi:MAG TPA: hypothetical protein VMH35_01395, partial [Streptosporangiaceae bacterium]|nr:hypothetical protein [Streptosporangiaceae bacterium]